MLVAVRRMDIARRFQELLRVFLELRQTVMAAKEIGLPVVDMVSCSLAGLHFHAADWINHDRFILCWREPERLPRSPILNSRNFGGTRCSDQLPQADEDHQYPKPLCFG